MASRPAFQHPDRPSTQLQQGTYSHGSYSYSCLAYDTQSDSSQTISSTSSYSSSATIHAKSTDTEWVETLDKWNNVYRATGYVLTSWYAEYTQTLGIAGSDSSTITNHESYASSIRGTSSGYDFSFSLISSTYDSFTTTSYSSSSSASSTYTGEHSTSLTGVLGSITGTDESSVSSTGTNTLHYKKQHLGLMVNGLATIVYDKITVDTSNSVTNSTSQSTTLEGHHADFDVYQYDYSGATITGSQSSHDYKEVAFDSTATNPWSLSSYNSIQTVSNGFSYDDESVFDMWHHVTASDPYSQTTWLYTHHRERSDTGSSAVTLAFHTRGHSTPDGSGGYSFVFDHYSVGISSSEGSTYSYSGFVSLLDQVSYTAPVGPYADSSNYSSFEWSKSRVRSGSESETIAGSTSGATFQYSSYSKNNTRDDDTEFEGYRYFDSSGPLGTGWSRQTLIYDEALEYDYTASTSDYSVSIDYIAPWTLSQSSSFLGSSSTSGTITKNEDDSGDDEKEVPAPVEVVGNFDGAKAPEYYGLGAGVVASYDGKETQPAPIEGPPRLTESAGATGLGAPDVPLQHEMNRPALVASAGAAGLGAENERNPVLLGAEPSFNLIDATGAFFNRLADALEGTMQMVGDGVILDGMLPYVYLRFTYGKEHADRMLPKMQQDVKDKYKEGLSKLWSDLRYGLQTIVNGKTWAALKGDYDADPSGFVGRMVADVFTFVQQARAALNFVKPPKTGKIPPAELATTQPPIKNSAPIIGCFPAGTMLQTTLGNKKIECFQVGDIVLTRDENNPNAPWQEGHVAATLRRTAMIWRMTVEGTQILTTSEHPFWVIGKGWVNANAIRINDRLRTLNGEVVVEASESTEEAAEVFNVSVEPSHTYFVGGDDWGFVVWSHNANFCWEPGLNSNNKTARARSRERIIDSPKNTELHHPLVQARGWKGFWEARGWSWEEIKKWIEIVDKDAHQGMEKAGLWKKQLKEMIAEAEAAQGGKLLNKAQTGKIAQELLDKFWDWLKPIEK